MTTGTISLRDPHQHMWHSHEYDGRLYCGLPSHRTRRASILATIEGPGEYRQSMRQTFGYVVSIDGAEPQVFLGGDKPPRFQRDYYTTVFVSGALYDAEELFA
jgi:hypothetical protein